MENLQLQPGSDRPGGNRRWTTMEGWRNITVNVHYIAGQGMRIMTVDPQFDPQNYSNDEEVETRSSRGREGFQTFDNRGGFRNDALIFEQARNPPPRFQSPAEVFENEKNPFSDAHATVTATTSKAPSIIKVSEPYHVYGPKQKWQLVIIIGAAGLFSGLSSNIYFPALDQISKDLNVSLDLVFLTITSYLVIQGISPVIWGSFADTVGRRPIYIASFTVYIIANIALSFSPNFAVLLIFRGLQSAGSASTVSIGNGVIQDITPPSERGGFISFYQAIRNFSIAVGPILGGALSNSFGFRSIFVFLLIISTLVLAMIVIMLPETLRSIAGNGSLRLTGVHQPLIQRFTKEPEYMRDPEPDVVRKKVTLKTFTDPLLLLKEKDILMNLILGGVVYTIWSMVTSTTTGLFKTTFGLNELLLGICFLPNGLGTIVGSTIIGKLMTRDYKRAEEEYKVTRGLPSTYKLPAKNAPADFEIEHARLRNLPWIAALFIVSTGVYGFTVGTQFSGVRGWIAVPLSLQFVIAATSNAVFAMNQTMVSDLCPGKGASSTAINNLVRCLLGALGVAFSQTLVDTYGSGPSFLGLALVVIACMPLLAINWTYGMRWRVARMERQEKSEGKKKATEA